MNTDITQLTDDKLLQLAANAKTTDASAGGHHKGRMNAKLFSEYEAEIISRGLEVPTDQHLYKVGIFNGEGTY